jgi:hypothetical protein
VTTTLESLVAQMTVNELAQRSGHSVAEVVELVLASGTRTRAPRSTGAAAPATNGRRKRGRKPGPKPGRGRKAGKAGKAASGSSYDETVLGAVKAAKGKVKAEELRKKVGGTPPQLRAALARLVEAGSVKSAGKARGTTYAAIA